MSQLIRYLTIAAAVVVVSACASRYPQTIRTDDTNLVAFSEAKRQAEVHEGRPARWGGVIADVRNSDDGTRIEVVNFGLNNFGRPRASDESQGRFVVYVNEFIDPEIYQRGRMVTALGEFQGLEEGQIGDFRYDYPVLAASGVELWKVQQTTTPMMHPGYYDPHSLWYRNHIWGVGPYRYYDPFYYPWGYRQVPVVRQPVQHRPHRPQQRPQGAIDDRRVRPTQQER